MGSGARSVSWAQVTAIVPQAAAAVAAVKVGPAGTEVSFVASAIVAGSGFPFPG